MLGAQIATSVDCPPLCNAPPKQHSAMGHEGIEALRDRCRDAVQSRLANLRERHAHSPQDWSPRPLKPLGSSSQETGTRQTFHKPAFNRAE